MGGRPRSARREDASLQPLARCADLRFGLAQLVSSIRKRLRIASMLGIRQYQPRKDAVSEIGSQLCPEKVK